MNFHQHSRETQQDRTILLERETLEDNYLDIFWPVDLKALHHDCQIQGSSLF